MTIVKVTIYASGTYNSIITETTPTSYNGGPPQCAIHSYCTDIHTHTHTMCILLLIESSSSTSDVLDKLNFGLPWLTLLRGVDAYINVIHVSNIHYHIARKFGGELNLVVYLCDHQIKISYLHTYVW